MLRWIDIIDHDVRLVILEAATDPRGFGGLCDALSVSAINSFLQSIPGDGSIDRARIDIGKPKPSGKLPRNTALPRRGRTINGDDPMNVSHLS